MNLREYVVTIGLLLLVAIVGYHYLSGLLLTTVETTAQGINYER